MAHPQQYDVILVNPRFLNIYQYKYPPYGLMFLAHSLKNAGYKVKIFDNQVEQQAVLYDLIRASNPLWAGFFVMTGPNLASALEISGTIKKLNPSTKIVWGGPHPTLLPEDTLKNELIDMVVLGEGERTAVALTNALKNNASLSAIAGIGYRDNGEITIAPERGFIEDWDKEVGLDWEGIEIRNYINRVKGYNNFPLITSRGCPFRCKFCWNLKANRRSWRAWSAEKVITEIKKIIPYGIDFISFIDDYIGSDLRRLETIIEFLRANNITWAVDGFRVGNHVTAELMQKFKECGCDHLYIGAECGNKKMLEYVHKDITVEQLLESARITGVYGINVKYAWIIGFPEETGKDRADLLDLIDQINKLNPDSAHYIGIFSPYPGSELYEATIKAGWVPPREIGEWALFREEVKLPYCKNMSYLKCIFFTCFFKFAVDSKQRAHSKTKLAYRLPFKLLKLTSHIRWEFRFFYFPVEFHILVAFKNILAKFGKKL